MAFPQTKLPLLTEILVDGAWSEETRRIEAGLTITRGRRDWASRVVASRADPVFPNETGRYSNRNPNSPLFGRLGRGTQLRHRIRWVSDQFTRTAASSWGSTPEGYPWINVGGAASDYSVTGTLGSHTHNATETRHASAIVLPAAVPDVTVTTRVDVTPTGASIFIGPAVGSDDANYYQARIEHTTGGQARLRIVRRRLGVEADVSGEVVVGASTATVPWRIRIQRLRTGLLRAKAWLTSGSEPAQWHLVASDTSLTSFTRGLCVSHRSSGNSNFGASLLFDDFEVNSFRFWGELSASTPQWDLSGKVVNAPLTASGVLERLSSPTQQQLSPARRTMLAAGPQTYYTMEDADGSTQLASALDGGTAVFGQWAPPGRPTPDLPQLAGEQAIPGSAACLALPPGNSVTVPIGPYVDTGRWAVHLGVRIPLVTDSGIVITVEHTNGYKTECLVLPTAFVGADGRAPDGSLAWSQSIPADPSTDLVGAPIQVEINGTSAGAWRVMLRSSTTGAALRTFTGTSAAAYGIPRSVRIEASGTVGQETSPIGVAHLGLLTSASYDTTNGGVPFARALGGWVNETAAARMARVAAEIGVNFFLMDVTDTTELLGVQPTDTAAEVMFRAAEADQGVLFEPRDAFGLAYRPRTTLYDQTGLQLDYTAGVIAPPFQPTSDGQILKNDVIAKRDGGSSARVIVRDGPLGTDEIGTADEELSWNVYADDQLPGIAGWRAHLGTWDEDRYPTLSVNFAAPDVAGSATLVGALAALDLEDVALVANQPTPWMPPTDVALLAEGSTEWFGDGRQWTITWNCSPAGPWRVLEYAADAGDTNPDLGRYEADPDALFLTLARDSTQTTWIVTSTPLFTMVADDYTPAIRADCEGEEVAITAGSSEILATFGSSVASAWPNADTGQPWTLSGGAASDYSSSGGAGLILFSTAGPRKQAQIGPAYADVRVRGRIRPTVLSAGAPIDQGLLVRRDAVADTAYELLLRFDVDGQVYLRVNRIVTGSATVLTTTPLGLAYTGASSFWLLVDVVGIDIRCKVWNTASSEPTGWVLVSDPGGITAAGQIGACCRVQSGNTNVPFSPAWDDVELLAPQRLTVTRSVNGVIKAHAAGAKLSLLDAAIYVP